MLKRRAKRGDLVKITNDYRILKEDGIDEPTILGQEFRVNKVYQEDGSVTLDNRGLFKYAYNFGPETFTIVPKLRKNAKSNKTKGKARSGKKA